MTQPELEAAIAEANRIFGRHESGQTRAVAPQSQEPPRKTASPAPRPSEKESWPPESLDAERRFAQPHAKLFPFIGRKVRTPAGVGTLLQVFQDRVTVLLDAELSKCSFFAPGEIEPANWSL